MFTIEDIANAEFEKSMRGYRPEAVHEFLAQLAAQIEQLTKEKEDLEKKLYILAGKVEEYRGEEDMLKTAMINAQRMGENVIREARQKADGIVREADLKANLIDEKAKARLLAEEDNFVQLQQKVAAFKAEVLAIYKVHIESLSELPIFDEQPNDEFSAPEDGAQENSIAAQEKYLQESEEENIFAKTIYDAQSEIAKPQQTVNVQDTENVPGQNSRPLEDDIYSSIFGISSEEDNEVENEAEQEHSHEPYSNISLDEDTSDLDSLFGLSKAGYKPVSITENEAEVEQPDDTAVYEKFKAAQPVQPHAEHITEEADNDAFKSFFDEESEEEELEKPPLKSSVFEKFNGINFKD